MGDLLGGTSGQILAKNSNTNMDFTWITNDIGDITAVTAGTGISGGGTSGAVTITNSMATEITASGDMIVGTGSGTFDNLPIGTTGQVLTADTTVSPYKVKWASPSSSGLVLITTASFSAAAAMSVNSCFSSTYTNYLIQFKLAVTTGTVDIYFKERSSGTDDSDFYYYGATKVTNGGTVTGSGAANTTAFTICNTSTDGYGQIFVYSPNVATNTYYDWKTMDFSPNIVSGGGLHASTPTTCDGFSIIPASSTITGTVSVYGYSK
jgi:hypothetical protein